MRNIILVFRFRIQCPVCRLDIKAKLDELDAENEGFHRNEQNNEIENYDEENSHENRVSEEEEHVQLNPIGFA